MPANSVADLIQTRNGYLWFATSRGFARFGGLRFTEFDHSNVAERGTERITRLHESRDSTFWIGTDAGGLLRHPSGLRARFIPGPALDGRTVLSLFEDLDGVPWIGTAGSGICRWSKCRFSTWPRRHGLEDGTIYALLENQLGHLWMIGLEGHDEQWVDAGTERVAHYTDLHPGEYSFRVVADDGYGVWGGEASIPFEITPRWWETWWSRSLAVLLITGLAAGLVQRRSRDIRHRNSALHHEIALRKRAEEGARQHQDELARIVRAGSMGELAASIAHEVNQPLFAIVTNAQIGRRMIESEDGLDIGVAAEILGDIEEDGNRAASIINNVRTLLQKHSHSTEPVDLNAIVLKVSEFYRSVAMLRGIRIDCQLANTLPMISGDAIELQQVLLNLFTNGAQAMQSCTDRSRRLEVRTSYREGAVLVSVRDHGVGIASAELDRIFETFYTTKSDGMGMGLAINRTIIEAHGGRIWAISSPGKGATVHVRLPVMAKHSEGA